MADECLLVPIGRVSSRLVDLAEAPAQGDEDAPEATVVIDAEFAPAIAGLSAGDDVIVVTWLDRADRSVLQVHPRGDRGRPLAGVFATRSPDRPNPIGLHEARVVSVGSASLRVAGLEAIDGTPVLDLKPVLGPVRER